MEFSDSAVETCSLTAVFKLILPRLVSYFSDTLYQSTRMGSN